MTRVQHATTAPISSLDRVPFPGAARVRPERMVLNPTDPRARAQHINYLEPAGKPGIFGPDSVSLACAQQSGDRINRARRRLILLHFLKEKFGTVCSNPPFENGPLTRRESVC